MKIAIILLLTLVSSTAFAANIAVEDNSTMVVIKSGLIVVCFAVAFVTAAVKSSLTGDTYPTAHIFFRLIFVVVAILAVNRIHTFIGNTGQSIADNIMADSSLMDIQNSLQDKINLAIQQQQASSGTPNPITNTDGFINSLAFQLKAMLASGALTVFFFAFKWFQSMQKVVMDFLLFVAPFMITASIIPGINGFTGWLKLLVSVALWPAIATYFLNAHIVASGTFLAGTEGGMLSSDVTNYYLNMDSLQLLSDALLCGFFMFATPFIATAIVNGSAMAFSVGSAFLIARGPLAIIKSPAQLLGKGTYDVAKPIAQFAGKKAVAGAKYAGGYVMKKLSPSAKHASTPVTKSSGA